ncbi:MAG: radical SAM/SPASM domain-containing protein [Azospirillaceae bacterium]|nr:radical SAM/SPASM domain-containing protein [Azospirillaceae bacterium]
MFDGRLNTPFAVFNIELTNHCPFKCVMCPRTHDMTRALGHMSFDVFQRIIDQLVDANPEYARNHGVWLHHFGESLVHPEFDRLMAYAAGRGVAPGLSVNPLMLTEKTAERLLMAKPAKLYLSLDGHDDESFARIRGVENAYQKSVERLLAFLEQKRALSPATRVILSMIHFDANIESIEKMRAYWENREGIDQFLDKPFTTFDGNSPEVSALRRREASPDTAPVSCKFPSQSVTITWDGDVVPCCFDFDKRYVLGNVLSESLADIWNGPALRALRLEFLSNRVENPLCRNCESLRQ